MERKLLDLKARQQMGERMPCPRCGEDRMKEPVHTNALSRVADVYVCDACGTAEALLAFMKQQYPLTCWAAFQPERPPADFKARPAARSWKRYCARRVRTCSESSFFAGMIPTTPSGTGLRHWKAAPA